MTDLVKRLRGTLADAARARFEAADRIEKLERELAAWKALAEQLYKEHCVIAGMDMIGASSAAFNGALTYRKAGGM